jgi:hypothetical protein
MFRPMLQPIPRVEIEAARSQFDSYGHVSMTGLFDLDLLEPAMEDVKGLSSALRTHNDGQRDTVTQLRAPDPEREASLQAILQGVQEGAAMLGGVLTLGQGCQLDLRQMESNMSGPLLQSRSSLVGGTVATVALEGQSYYALRGEQPGQDGDYFVRPGEIIFEDLRKRLAQRSYTGDSGRTTLTIANTLDALPDPQSVTTTSRQNAT